MLITEQFTPNYKDTASRDHDKEQKFCVIYSWQNNLSTLTCLQFSLLHFELWNFSWKENIYMKYHSAQQILNSPYKTILTLQ